MKHSTEMTKTKDSSSNIAFSSFDRQCTTFIKGLAIMLMVCHHMWAFRSVGDFTGVWGEIAEALIALGKAGKICVAIFTFISGYGIYLSFGRHKSYKRIACKIKTVLFHFWRTVLPVLIILFITGIMPFNIVDFLKNMFCISSSYNGSWWYLQTYILFLIFSPVFYLLVRNKFSAIILTAVSMTLFRYWAYQLPVNFLYYFLYYAPFFVIGAIFARFDLFRKLTSADHGTLLLAVYVGAMIILMVLRMATGCTEILFLLMPCFMLAFVQKPMPDVVLTRSVIFLGKYSMGIWLLHSFFIEQIPLQSVTNNCVLHFIMIFGISLAITFVIEKANKKVFHNV